MLGTGFRQLFTGARANITDRVGVFRASLEELTGQRRDPRHVPRDDDDLRDLVDIRLGQTRRDCTFAPASGDITGFDAIAKFGRPHKFIPRLTFSPFISLDAE
jgi:hypothetical protein